ncbi:MAG: response regulator [Oligoflexales bacterium]|nr:response regulator [Oligoflexales bacterium]
MLFKVAYVDDEIDMCKMFVDNFSSSEIFIKYFCDPQMFLDEFKNQEFDLIIVDYRFPNTNGDKIAKDLDSNIPKVLVSGDLHINPRQEFLRIFTKPFDFEEMEIFLKTLAVQKKLKKSS